MLLHLPLLTAMLATPPHVVHDSTRILRATAIAAEAEAPRIDGVLEESAWATAEVARDFVQQQPDPGAAASQSTEARVLYDEKAVYVGMRMYDTRPDSIAAQLARRDAFGIYSDWAHVMLDSYHDRRTAFRFSVNPRGVKQDIYHFDDSNEDASWDAVWEVATSVDSLGWTAEFRIPLSQLRFSVGGGGDLVWGINLGREIARHDERAYWSPVPPRTERAVSLAGELRGLSGLRAPRRLEVQPYAVTRYTRAPGDSEDPYYRRNALGASMGADLKYGVTSNLTLTATINPDFGQVEADPSQVNLSAFESFFPERRPFFTEGMDMFRFPLGQIDVNGNEELFYSRRIGRAPQRGLPSEGFVDAPEAATILGAAKLSGKTKNGWTVGFLDAVTGREDVRVFSGGLETRLQVEPLTNYAMARVSRDFGAGKSTLGTVFTATNRRIEVGSGLDFLRTEAYAGGADARHRFGGGNYQVSGSLLGSHIGGSRESILSAQLATSRLFQRPDADHVEVDSTRTRLNGVSANFALSKIGGGNWRGGVFSAARTPGFEVNDLGFQRLADGGTVIGTISYTQSSPGRVFRNWSLGVDAGSAWTFGGERFLTAVVPRGNFELQNRWSVGGQLVRFLPGLSPTMLRGGPALHTPARNVAIGFLGSDPRPRLRLTAFTVLETEEGTGGYVWNAGPELSVRPSSRATFSLAPVWSRNVNSWQFLTRERGAGGSRYLGGHLEQKTVSLYARTSYSFSPDFSLELYAQPFVSAGEYSEFREVAAPRAERFAERFRPATISFDPDFSVKELRSNAVLRWEYRPGSTLFVVWSQGREQHLSEGSFALVRDFGRLFGMDEGFPAPSTNVLLIKLTYWLGG